MFRIKVECLLDKPIERVFDAISDHAHYNRFPGIHESSILSEGVNEPNGEGALRKIKAKPFTFIERITHFKRPNKMRYIIEKASPIAMRHQLGDISLSSEKGKTRVVWVSEGYMKLPLYSHKIISTSVDKIVERQAAKTFKAILMHIEKVA